MKLILTVMTTTWRTTIIFQILKRKILRYHLLLHCRPVTGFCFFRCWYRNAVSVGQYYWKVTRSETTTQETSFDWRLFLYKTFSVVDIYDLYIHILKTVSSIIYILIYRCYWCMIVRSPINQKIMPGGLRIFHLTWEHTKISKSAEDGHLNWTDSFFLHQGFPFYRGLTVTLKLNVI